MGKPEELERIIEDLPNKPFLVGEEGVSMSLAGVQSKLAVAVDEGGRMGGTIWAVQNWGKQEAAGHYCL